MKIIGKTNAFSVDSIAEVTSVHISLASCGLHVDIIRSEHIYFDFMVPYSLAASIYFQLTGLDFLLFALLPTAPRANFLPVPSLAATSPCFAVGIRTAYIHRRNQLAAGPFSSTSPPNVEIVASLVPSVIISPRLRNLNGSSLFDCFCWPFLS